MKKKLVIWLLTGSMVMGVLSGCGSKSDMSTSDTAREWSLSAPAAEEAMPAADEALIYENNYTEGETAKADMSNGSYMDSIYDYDTSVQKKQQGTEEYSEISETGFSAVTKEPLSTFAADVDTASYSNLRRLIQSGYGIDEIPDGAVRIEELLNYFTYDDYNLPERNEPFGVTTEISTCPWNPETELMMIGLKTQDIDYDKAPPSNLVFLLDVSGSMNDADKLPLLQKSFSMLTENLTEKDRVSIVTYAGSDKVVLDGVKGSKHKVIIDALNDLEAGGSTYGSKGIITAYKLAEENFIKGGNNRVILATDGDLNVGLTSESELEDLISEKKETGVYLSVLGFGTGNIKDNKMETLADKGNGNYSYIDSEREANKVLVQEMGATLVTVCKDVKFQVEFNPAVVKEYRLIGYENRRLAKEDFKDDTKDAGEIGAGHSVTALYEIKLQDPLSVYREGIEDLKYAKYHEADRVQGDNNALSMEWLTISIRYKKPAENTSSLLSYPIDAGSLSSNPGNDWKFAAAVAEFGLLVSDSENKGDASLKQVLSILKSVRLNDEYKEEFYDLVKQIERNS